MKTRKQLFCFLLTIVMLFSLTTPALAGELTTEETLEDYAYAAMKRYIGINGLGRELNMTQPIHISNRSDDAWTVFLFDGVNCVGKMTVARVNGVFTSSFCVGSYDAVEPLVARNMPFALTVKDRSLLLLGENTSATLEGPTVLLSAAETKALLSSAQSQTASLRKVTLTEAEMAAKSASCALTVDFVANKPHPDMAGHHLCWAASAASIIRYWNSSYPNLQTLTIYNRMCTLYGTSAGYPYGTTTWINRVFSAYSVSMTYVSHGTNYSTVKNIIENRSRPIVASLIGEDGGHNIIISGFTSGYGHYYYVIVDSNNTAIVTAEVTNTSANTFTYPAGNKTYTNWQYYYY